MQVKKAFNSRLRRFFPGDEVHETSDVRPHTVEGLKAGGFVAPDASETKQKPRKSRA